MRTPRPLVVRWTVGNVSRWGFEALRLSLWGAHRLFGPKARYVVCVNSVPMDEARTMTGSAPASVEWRDVNDQLPSCLADRLDENMAEGVGWKFAPLRVAFDAYELSLDNDCILWDQPPAVREWLSGNDASATVIAEDERRMLGGFSDLCGPEPRNSGIRGLPPGFDLENALLAVLEERPLMLRSELDEQGLQVAALSRRSHPLVVRTDEVTICSPFPPHRRDLGTCGAHFVGLNAHGLPWDYEGRPAVNWIREHWSWHRDEIRRRVGAPRDRTQAVPADEVIS